MTMNGSLYLDDAGGTIRWLDIGQGDPIVFLPALSMPVITGFAAVAAELVAANRRCILIDYLGSGLSDHPTSFDYSLASHADAVLSATESIGISSYDLVGHSMGGTVGIEVAIRKPEVVRRLVVGEGNIVPGGGMMSLRIAGDGREAFLSGGYQKLMKSFRKKANAGASGPDRLVAAWQITDPAGLFENARALVELDDQFFEKFGALPMPKSFIYGQEGYEQGPTPDAPNPEELSLRGIAPFVVENAGHWMMLDNHDGFMDVLHKALEL